MSDGESRKEVLYIWPYLEWGGAQIYFMGLMKLARERYEVRAVMPRGSADRLLGYLQETGVPCEFFDAHWDMSRAVTFRERLRRRWRKARTEIVIARYLGWHRVSRSLLHVDFGPWSSFWFLLYLSARGQVFVTLHTSLPQPSWLRRQEWKLKFRVLCAIKGFHLLASNEDMIQNLKAYLPPKKIPSVPLAYSGVDQKEIEQTLEADFERTALCRKFRLSPESFFVFGMGQFIQRKGCWVLLESAQCLIEQYSEMCFVWIGTEEPCQDTERRIAAYQLGDSFRLMTSKEIGQGRTSLLTLLRLADVFVLPSLNEGLPVALIEAMALGKACVASRINAIPEAIRDEITGLLVPPGDSRALGVAISRMRDRPDVRSRLAEAGREFVLRNFDEHRTAQITVDLYDACSRAG